MSGLEEIRSLYADIRALRAATSLLNWDRQTFMPPGGATARSAHVALLSRMSHEHLVDGRLSDLIQSSTPQNEEEAAMLAALERELDTLTKLPTELVERKARVSMDAY